MACGNTGPLTHVSSSLAQAGTAYLLPPSREEWNTRAISAEVPRAAASKQCSCRGVPLRCIISAAQLLCRHTLTLL